MSAVAGCRAAGTGGVTPVTRLLAFLPWLLAPTGVALLCALFARRWSAPVWAVAVAVTVLGLLAWFAGPYEETGEPRDRPRLHPVLTSDVECEYT
ncbi:hypothetical protein [Streptomyces sp. NPDC006739]|uniref:hypothetical protein n=1 Tax=Streptomyces sp. NPDC006739 TaxID=3364763 RepID=UPI0036751BFF